MGRKIRSDFNKSHSPRETVPLQFPIFIDEDPEDFAYILRALRGSNEVPTAVPKERIDNVISLCHRLQIQEIRFMYRLSVKSKSR
jgi:hypothetical protein